MSYRRNEKQFYNDDDTLLCIASLAHQNHLIFIVGAGSTIDLTGQDWGSHVVGMFDRPNQETRADRPTKQEAKQLIKAMGPLPVTSILTQYDLIHDGTMDKVRQSAVTRMQQRLYQNSTWQAGKLVPNIVRLAFALMAQGKQVTIITSNQETYIEDSYRDYLEDLRKRGTPQVPGLVVTAFKENQTIVNEAPTGTEAKLHLFYQHGRVPKVGDSSGFIPLSENDYFDNFAELVAALTKMLDIDDSGVLCLGSSLTDLPQVAALSATRKRKNRVALLPVSSNNLSGFDGLAAQRLMSQSQLRGTHLGITILLPDFHFQIAQFCEEIRTALTLPRRSVGYANKRSRSRYGSRLIAWWKRFSKDAGLDGRVQAQKDLKASLDRVKRILNWHSEDVPAGEDPELLRLELWVRFDPANHRRLALWASSNFLLIEEADMRFAELELGTHNAAVEGFIEGRPRVTTWDRLREGGAHPRDAADNSRWKTFLPVPLRAISGNSEIPVAVISLASSRPLDSSTIPAGDVTKMNELIIELETTGTALIQK